MIYDPRILNLRLCFMKVHVIRYTRSNLLISDSDSEISNVNEQTRHSNYDKSNSSELCWTLTSESRIIIKTKFFLWGSFRLECQKSLRVWFIREKWLAQSRGALNINKFLKAEASAIAFSFAWFFLFLMITFFYLF